MPAKFEIKTGKNKRFFFHLLSTNGQVILASQMYASQATAKKGVASVQANAGDPNNYDRRTDKKGQHYFVLKAPNRRIIGRSESYSSAAMMEKGIKSVMKNGATAKLLPESR